MERLLTRVLIILAALATTACISDDDPENSGVVAGDPLPQFSITLSDGSIVGTSSLTGKTSILEFFNTGCPDCRESLPLLQEFYYRVKGNPDVIVIAIAREEEEDAIEVFWRENGLDIPFSPQPDRSIYNLFATVGIPRIYVADPEGIIIKTYGPDDFSLLDADFPSLLPE